MRRRGFRSTVGRARFRRALLAASLALVLSPSAASAAVITFDDLTPAPPPPGTHGTPVNVQYASQGVTFNDPEAFTYGSAFAHSDGVGVEACVAVEFCQAPIRADFTAPQDSVGVWVGYHASLSQSETVHLNAFDASNTQIGTDSATLPANSAVTPIQTHLTVAPASGKIAYVEITTGSGYNNFLAIDDLEFTTAGPPPTCHATGPPTIDITQPSGGLGVQNNAFTIAGIVAPNGDQITGASFVATSATTHAASVFPVLIGSNGGSFGPISVEGLLSPGSNDVTVTATNCAGTGTSVARSIDYSPIPPGTQFNQLGMIEVNQTVQNTFDSVPLIAAGPTSFKRTIARVYLGVQGTTSVSQVTGTLEATFPDGSRAPGPAQVPSLNAITVLSSNTPSNTRSSLASSLNFELPKEWLAAGRIHLQLAHLYVEGEENHLPCNGCDNPFTDSLTPASYRFYAVPPVRIWLVRVPYKATPTSTTSVAPTQNDIDMLVSWLKRTYPTAEVSDTQVWMPVQNDHPQVVDSTGKVTSAGFTCTDINGRLKDWASSMQAQAPNTRYYGVVSDNSGTMFMRGCSEIGGTYGSGPAGVGSSFTNFKWDTDSSYADWYGGHEIGHLYGRRHPGYCNGNSHDDSNYPYGGGLIGGSSVNGILADTQGVDVGDSSLSLPMRILDWRSGATDIMTYCANEWMSDYTYEGILDNLCGHEHQNCPDHTALGAAASVSAARRHDNRPRLVVNGSLSLDTGRLRLRPLFELPGPALTSRPGHSPYSIVEEGARHQLLAAYPFAPKMVSDLPRGQREASVHEVVPFNRATTWIVVERSGHALARIHVSRRAPTVELLAPSGRRRLGRHVLLRWRSRSRATYALLYSPDGRTFVPIAAGLHRTSYRVDTRHLPGGRLARFRVIAIAGVRTGIATSPKPLTLAFKRPLVSIASPRSGSRLTAGSLVQFTADVEDIQNQILPRRSIVWRSSLHGVIGRGPTIAVTLKPGKQKITVTATNRGGKRATAAITVYVAAVPRVFKVAP
jgi:hypothetical protein